MPKSEIFRAPSAIFLGSNPILVALHGLRAMTSTDKNTEPDKSELSLVAIKYPSSSELLDALENHHEPIEFILQIY